MRMMSLRTVQAVFLSLVIAASAFSAYMIVANSADDSKPSGDLLPAFTSMDQLSGFLDDMSSAADRYDSVGVFAPQELGTDASYGGAGEYFTSTNIQVAGVDEEDLVKTDGEYMYLCAYQNITVVRAYPPGEMQIVSTILLSDLGIGPDQNQTGWIRGIYLTGQRLVVVVDVSPGYWMYYDTVATTGPEQSMPRTTVAVLDVSDPAQPELMASFSVSGYSLATRMVGQTLYLVTQHYVWMYDGSYILPATWVDGDATELAAGDVHYDPNSSDVSSYVNIMAVHTDALDSSCMSIIAGYASVIYMSTDHLYLTFQKWDGGVVLVEDAVTPESETTASTTIYKVRTDGLDMETVARGTVAGWLLNQFSMDESGQYLRVATTTDWTNPENAVYVLGEDLGAVGALEGIAPAERIFSARFLGDTLYLVTFYQVDPLFVIDLSAPSDPKVIGELEVPGFSSYLHPVGDGYLVGIGQQNGTVKVTLFDVTDGSDPKEVGTYVVEGDCSWSATQWDHKAVTWDPLHSLLVFPVDVYDYENWTDSYSGFIVLSVSTETGLALHGTVYQNGYCQRSVVIGEYLYTVSGLSLRATDLSTMAQAGEIVFGYPCTWGWEVGGTITG